MKAYLRYFKKIQSKLSHVTDQLDKLETAADWVTHTIQSKGFIYSSGTGHSHMFAEEIFYRAGGFARVVPILDEALMLHKDASHSTEVERTSGYADKLLAEYSIGPNDIFIISSNSGRNTVSIDMALLAKNKGAKVIVITSLQHTMAITSRHPSGKKLYEIADLYFDNAGDIGDAAVSIQGLDYKVGATSTVIGTVILHGIMVQAVEQLVEQGEKPEIFSSSNSESGEIHNEELIKKYKGVIKGL